MEIKRLLHGIFDSNCYIIYEDGKGVVIDPGVRIEEIEKELGKLNIEIKYIFLTHAHIDHIVSVDKLKEKTKALVAIHELDSKSMQSEHYNRSNAFGLNYSFKPADILLKGGDKIKVGNMEFEIIHTPGHTSGGICIKIDNCLFSGDTLFRMSIGRVDLGDGDMSLLMNSINNVLMKLNEEITVYPGHGTTTTIGYEKQNNVYITG